MDAKLDLAKLRAQSKLFSLLDEAGQTRLVAVAVSERHPAGATVVSQGDRGDSFYVVLDGSLEVTVDDMGRAKKVARLERGGLFGEIAAIVGEARSATVTAFTDVQLLRFDMPRVHGLLDAYPNVRQVLVKLGMKRSEDNLAQMMKDDSG